MEGCLDLLLEWLGVLDRFELPGRQDVGALRLRLVATKNQPADGFPLKGEDGKYDPAVVLDLDYTVALPRRPLVFTGVCEGEPPRPL